MLKEYVCTSSVCSLPTTPQHGEIVVHRAQVHNLKDVCFKFPKNKLVALTGPSGSGKSSIAVDILGNESLRQLLSGYGLITDHIQKVEVGTILGLSPAITISQRTTDVNPRSVVGTKTGILTLLRNLFATIAHQHCFHCGADVNQLLHSKHTLKIVQEKSSASTTTRKKRKFFACPSCGEHVEKMQMAHFSPNTALGVCEVCKGLGDMLDVDSDRLFDEDLSILEGGVSIWDAPTAKHYAAVVMAASSYYDFPFDESLPIKSYGSQAREFLMYGCAATPFRGIKAPKKASDGKFQGIVPNILALYKKNPKKVPDSIKRYITRQRCLDCDATGLGSVGRHATIAGKTIIEVVKLSLADFLSWLQGLETDLSRGEKQAFAASSHALMERASAIIELGLDYLTLDRSLPSLSAGEAQRLRLSAALGSGSLTGVLYILDEPTTGLHPFDTAKLLATLRKIQANDNTVLFIEHDFDVVRAADYVIDVGPGRGAQGGEIVVAGKPADVAACARSITGKYLTQDKIIKSKRHNSGDGNVITVRGAREHNLKNIDVAIPLQQFVVLTGVSGSGKSTFLFGVLGKAVRRYLNRAQVVPGAYASIDGVDNVNRVVTINQSTVGRTKSSRSNVATYTKLFDLIRDIFALLPESKSRGYTASSFSFNTSKERCQNCDGSGVVPVDMAFLPDIEMECPLCRGMRFSDELLTVKYKGYTIAQVLSLTVNEAISVFDQEENIREILQLMKRVGLEHLGLGQSTSTLSGGEAQRIKLASELWKTGTPQTLYLLDEPTTGLHPEEVGKLLAILQELVEKGNTVVVIEHNIDVMCNADTIIDFGPRGGAAGGTIVAQGTPEQVAAKKDSLTGQCLREVLHKMV